MRGAHEHVDTKIDGEFRLQEGKVAHLKVRRVARAALLCLLPPLGWPVSREIRQRQDLPSSTVSLRERERERLFLAKHDTPSS